VSHNTWTPHAVSSEAHPWLGLVWRMTEAQHVVAAMKLVDDVDEQDLLESLVEEGEPPGMSGTLGLHPLLAAPFRYDPMRGGSRFRARGDPGVFYGCESVRTATAELGYWRWKFLRDAPGLERIEPVAHSAFCVDVATMAVDLRRLPFMRLARRWTDPSHYAATQAFARIAREGKVGGIVYQSVRDPHPAWCMVLLTPTAFARPRPRGAIQTWYLAVTREAVTWRRETEALHYESAVWQDDEVR